MAKTKTEVDETANVETTETVQAEGVKEQTEQAEQTAPADETKTETDEQQTEPVESEISVEIPTEQIEKMKAEILEEIKAEYEQAAEKLLKENEELKQKIEAAEKLVTQQAEQLKAAGTQGNNGSYLEYLNQLEAKFNEYPRIRRERLRREFVTDITEEIKRQKVLLTNA